MHWDDQEPRTVRAIISGLAFFAVAIVLGVAVGLAASALRWAP